MSHFRPIWIPIWIIVTAGSVLAADASREARAAFERTDYPRVLQLLQPVARTADDWILVGRAYFMQQEFKRATEAFETAVRLDPANSDHYLWLGRGLGRRAETSSPFRAPGLATKSRAAFEKAVELNPKNREALSDLFEYYLQAPGFLGGGEKKAQALIEKIAALDPAERYFAEARLAENRKEYQTAERMLRNAVDAAPRQIGRLIDLARLLSKEGKIQESEATFEQAARLNPNAPQLLFGRAQTYVEAKRNLPQARQLLSQYLRSQLTPDDPPRAEAEKLLREIGGE